MKERRLVRVPISFELIRDMMDEDYETPGIIKTVKGLPSDAVMVNDGFDIINQEAYLFFYHESFDSVPAGTMIPERPITHQVDYTHTDLLKKWMRGFKRLRNRGQNDVVLDTVIDQELDEVAHDTWEYIKDSL